MKDDPIVAEVRAARAKLMEECGNDLATFFQRIRELEQHHPERLITKEQLDARRGKITTANAPRSVAPLKAG